MDKIKLVKTWFNLFDDKLVSIDQNMPYLLKIRKWSPEDKKKKKPVLDPRSKISRIKRVIMGEEKSIRLQLWPS